VQRIPPRPGLIWAAGCGREPVMIFTRRGTGVAPLLDHRGNTREEDASLVFDVRIFSANNCCPPPPEALRGAKKNAGARSLAAAMKEEIRHRGF